MRSRIVCHTVILNLSWAILVNLLPIVVPVVRQPVALYGLFNNYPKPGSYLTVRQLLAAGSPRPRRPPWYVSAGAICAGSSADWPPAVTAGYWRDAL